MQIEAIDVILLKNQAARGTAEDALDETDTAEVEVGATVSTDYRVKDIDLVGSPQNQSIIGPRECGLSFVYPIRTGATTDDLLHIGSILNSCFMVDTPAANVHVFTPTYKDSEWVESTVWAYSGCQDTSLSLLTKVQNCQFGLKINLDFASAYASLQVEGKGVLVATPALDTQPTITPSVVVPPALIGATISFFSDADYIPVSIEFDLGPDVTATLNPSNASGLGITQPGSKRKIKWSAKVYHDSGVIPHTELEVGTLGGISVAWGIAPNKITVATTKAQITAIKKSEQDGVTCFDVSGPCVDNDFSISLDTTVTP